MLLTSIQIGYLFTNIAFFVQMCQPLEQKTLYFNSQWMNRTIRAIRESVSRPLSIRQLDILLTSGGVIHEWNDPWSSWITFCGRKNSAHRSERAIVRTNNIGQPSKYAHAISRSLRAEYDARLSDTMLVM